MPRHHLSNEKLFQFDRDGFLIAPNLLNEEEVTLLGEIAGADPQVADALVSRRDATGGAVRLSVANNLGDDIQSAIVRSRRIVDLVEQLLGGEAYHYHHKFIFKEARTGGAWEWHQDYGYWYDNGCLFPEMVSCLIAVDAAVRENGCLQVLRGSHRMGRINHIPVGDQTAADPERVNAARQRLEHVYVELPPGHAVIFHANLLHCSDANTSELPRRAFIACYNTARNNPYKESRHPRYSYLEKWDDSRILEIGRAQRASLQNV